MKAVETKSHSSNASRAAEPFFQPEKETSFFDGRDVAQPKPAFESEEGTVQAKLDRPAAGARGSQGAFFASSGDGGFFSNTGAPFFTPTRPQAKLTVGRPDDRYEQEADQMADAVMRMPESTVASDAAHRPPSIQRRCSDCAEEVQREELGQGEEERELRSTLSSSPAPQLQRKSIQGGGQPLSASTRAFFEPRFGHDFSGVRVHTGSEAAAQAKSINAQAFTTGSDVVFGEGRYAPDTQEGRWLIGHELTHVVQQGQADRAASSGQEALEAEADHAADAVTMGGSFQPQRTAASGARMAALVATGPGSVEFIGDRIILTNFDIEGDAMKPEWLRALLSVALRLNLNPSKEAEIDGHASSTGAASINVPLSLRRADTIQGFLEALVLEPEVASPLLIGHGSNVPIGNNATAAGRARNRRVEIRIVDRPLPTVERVELLNSAAAQTFGVAAAAPVLGSDHGVTVAREAGADPRVRAVLNPSLDPGDRRLLLLQWTGATQDLANPIEATMSRTAGQHAGVARISAPTPPIRASQAQFTVWSVDAAITPSGVPAITHEVPRHDVLRTRASLTFTAAITPQTLFTQADRPDLTGVNPTPVPDSGSHLCGAALVGGATRRWDISRRLRQRTLNPAGLVKIFGGGQCFWSNLLRLPVNNAEGNDDTTATDERPNDPYANPGQLNSSDGPSESIVHTQGAHGDTLEVRMHFQEFARLDLNGRWRLISDPSPWRFHFRVFKINIPIVGPDRWFDASNSALDNTGI